MRLLTALFLITFFISCNNSKGINIELKRQLDQILHNDQTLRELFDSKTTEKRKVDILKEFNISQEEFKKRSWMIVAKEDSLNLKAVEKIIAKYGYPGRTLVGEPTNESVWFVIQHSDKIEKYFPIIKNAGRKNEIADSLVAKMEDRLLMSRQKEQIYGTQGSGETIRNKETGEEEFFTYIWPIKEPEKVNDLRKKIGFKTTVEENAKNMEIEFKIYTLKEIIEKRQK